MCGIAGVFGMRHPESVAAMLPLIEHRGPDDQSFVEGAGFTIGARRLSIMDLENGRQPMSDERGGIWGALNGEIYNMPALNAWLIERGHRLRTRCDTELLPHLFSELGPSMVERLDGMFAFAVFDEGSRRGMLARDRFGKKPLYYAMHEGAVWFASEIKCLLALPWIDSSLDLEALRLHLALKHVPGPHTAFASIRELPPGHRLCWHDGRFDIDAWFQLDWSPLHARELPSEAEAVDRIETLLDDAVGRRMIADVPIGFYLSGGLDSSLTTIMAAKRSPGRIRTFTLVYDGESEHEGKALDRHWARFVAERCGSEHHELEMRNEALPELLDAALDAFDQPFAGVLSTLTLSELIRRHVKVAVSGDGADQLFGSYRSHRMAIPMANLQAWRNDPRPQLLPNYVGASKELESLWSPHAWRWRARLGVFDDGELDDLWPRARSLHRASGRSPLGDDPCGPVECYWQSLFQTGTAARDPLNAMLEAEFRSQLPDQVLAFVDRLSMAHGLEVRSPFMDTALISFAARLPGAWKISDGAPKRLLRLLAAKHFPREMIERPKEGFHMPVGSWLHGRLRTWVRSTLVADRLVVAPMLDAKRVLALRDAFLSAPAPDWRRGLQVYGLTVFVRWLSTLDARVRDLRARGGLSAHARD